MSDTTSSFAKVPRSARWAIAGCAIILGYFLIVEPLMDHWTVIAAKADQRSVALAAFESERGSRKDARATVALSISRHGEVAWPGDPGSRMDAFNRRVSEVFTRHNVRDQRTLSRSASLPKGPLLDALGSGSAVTRQTYEISFDATPEQIAGIVADLERSPEIAAVSRVLMRRSEDLDRQRQVRATIAVEAWLLARKGGTR
jgi:hypothetical protein